MSVLLLSRGLVPCAHQPSLAGRIDPGIAVTSSGQTMRRIRAPPGHHRPAPAGKECRQSDLPLSIANLRSMAWFGLVLFHRCLFRSAEAALSPNSPAVCVTLHNSWGKGALCAFFSEGGARNAEILWTFCPEDYYRRVFR